MWWITHACQNINLLKKILLPLYIDHKTNNNKKMKQFLCASSERRDVKQSRFKNISFRKIKKGLKRPEKRFEEVFFLHHLIYCEKWFLLRKFVVLMISPPPPPPLIPNRVNESLIQSSSSKDGIEYFHQGQLTCWNQVSFYKTLCKIFQCW